MHQAGAAATRLTGAEAAARAEAVAQREAAPRPEERAVVGQREAVPLLEAAEEVVVWGAAEGPRPAVEEAARDAAEERRPGAAVAAPDVAAGPRPEGVVVAERDGAALLRAAAEHAAGLPQAVLPSVPPSASVCRRGRLRPRAVPPAPRPVARSARGRPSLQSASL